MTAAPWTVVERAREVAAELVSPLGDRWGHVQGVAARAEELVKAVPADDGPLLIAAAWLHDIGYAPRAARTGLHQLDGARLLEKRGFSPRLVGLVAHHSGARFEADERSLRAELDAYPIEDGPVLDALITADMTVGPVGQRLEFDARVAEILTRYPEDTVVHCAISRARPYLEQAIERTLQRVA